jgi:hypothetical protein
LSIFVLGRMSMCWALTAQSAEPLPLQPIESQPIVDDKLPALEPVPPIELTPISQLTTSVAPPTGEMPRNHAADALHEPTALLGDPAEPIRTSAPFYSTPRTADFVNRPLYFEQRATERNGQSWGPAQPIVSGAQFFGTVLVMPYKMGAQPPWMRLNTGNGVVIPSDYLTWRQRFRGAAAQAGAVVGLGLAIP